MKILNNLIATADVQPWTEPRGNISALHLEPAKGFFIRAELGAAGLTFTRKQTTIGIPLDELLKLVQVADPEFIPPQARESQPAPKPKPLNPT